MEDCARDRDLKSYPVKTGSTSHHTGLFLPWSMLSFQTGNASMSPALEDFRHWLGDFRMSFRRGICAKEINENEFMTLWHCQDGGSGDVDEAVSAFGDETLGGHVGYSALVSPVRKLKEDPEGLIICYDPSSSTSVPTVKENEGGIYLSVLARQVVEFSSTLASLYLPHTTVYRFRDISFVLASCAEIRLRMGPGPPRSRSTRQTHGLDP